MNPEIFAKELAKYGFELNEKQKKQFATYYDKLVEFNKKVNLTRITDKNEVYLKHFLVCMQVFQPQVWKNIHHLKKR